MKLPLAIILAVLVCLVLLLPNASNLVTVMIGFTSMVLIVTYFINFRVGALLTVFLLPLISQFMVIHMGGSSFSMVLGVVFFSFLITLIWKAHLDAKITYGYLDVILVLFILYLAFSIFVVSGNVSYGKEKLLYLFTSYLLLYMPVVMVKKRSDIKYIIIAFIMYGLLYLCYSIAQYLKIYENPLQLVVTERFSVFSINPIYYARDLFTSALSMLVAIAFLGRDFKHNVGKITILLLCVFALTFFAALSGSRGPILAFWVGLFITALVYASKYKTIRKVILYTIVIVLCSMLILLTLLPEDINSRLLNLNASGQNTTTLRLMAAYQGLLDFWGSKLFGIGFGSYLLDTPIFDRLVYPHNMIIEILAETGLIGFVMLMTIFGLVIRMIILEIRYRIDLYLLFAIALFVMSFTNTNFSGHIGYNKYFWFSIGLIYSLRRLQYEK